MLNRVIMAAVFAMAVSVTASAQERLVPGDAFRDCAGCPEIVDVPAGMSKTDVRAMLAKMFARQRESAVVSKIMGADTRRHEPGGRRGPASQEKPKPRTTKQAMVKPRTSKGAPEVAPSTDGDGRPIDPLSGFSRAPADGAGAKAGAPKRVVVRRAPTLDLMTRPVLPVAHPVPFIWDGLPDQIRQVPPSGIDPVTRPLFVWDRIWVPRGQRRTFQY